MINKGSYMYKDVPLKRSLMKALILYLYTDETVNNNVIFDKISNFHYTNGGAMSSSKAPKKEMGKALSELRKIGKVKLISNGYWHIGQEESVIQDDEFQNFIEDQDLTNRELKSGIVYLCYYPLYKKTAIENNKSTWRCKIGESMYGDVKDTRPGDVSFCPEQLVYSFIVFTKERRAFEKLLHNLLRFQGKQVADAPGNEWFETNPKEVLKLIHLNFPNYAENIKIIDGID